MYCRYSPALTAEVTTELVRYLAERNCTSVSGLALGVDALAHRAALDCGGHTVAVLAHDLDSVYPREHLELAEEILARGGALLSEQPVGTPVARYALAARDRIQSGMSVGTVVMQTPLGGGSMQTVRYALTQKRLLFAPVPHNERLRADPANQGDLVLTRLPGPQMAIHIEATGRYHDLLRSDFADRPPATPIRSRGEYEAVLVPIRLGIARALSRCASGAGITSPVPAAGYAVSRHAMPDHLPPTAAGHKPAWGGPVSASTRRARRWQLTTTQVISTCSVAFANPQ